MFRTKKMLAVLLVLVLIASAICLVACTDNNVQEGQKNVTLIVGEQTISVTTDANYVHDMLVELNEKGQLVYEFTLGDYGATVMKLGALSGKADWSQWIAVYHDIDDIALYVPGYDITLNDKAYFSSSIGVSGLAVIDGATYVFVQN